jgi:hypothetical protein
VARLETASFGEVVRCFSSHGTRQSLSAPDLYSLRNSSYRTPVNRVRRPSVFCARRLTQPLSWNSAHKYTSSRTLTPTILSAGAEGSDPRKHLLVRYWRAGGRARPLSMGPLMVSRYKPGVSSLQARYPAVDNPICGVLAPP